jgi:hypothetical protein
MNQRDLLIFLSAVFRTLTPAISQPNLLLTEP